LRRLTFVAVATIFVGFNWGGWSLGSTADKMAKERSEAAVVAVLAPVCRAQPNAAAKIVATSKVDLYEDLRSKINTRRRGRRRAEPIPTIFRTAPTAMVRLRNTKERKTLGRRGWERMVQDRMVEEACPEVQGALALIGRHRQAAAFNSVNQTGGTRCSDSF
jgi:hypothetical protein